MNREHNAKSLIKTVKRKTRKLYSTEEKIRIVIEGIRGEYTIAELCRKEGITDGTYYKWTKDFMEAGKKRLSGDTMREANTTEVNELKQENSSLKELVAELSLENRVLKKNLNGHLKKRKYMHYSPSEKYEIIRLVEQSELGVTRTLKELKINKTTFYNWYNAYLEKGYGGLVRKRSKSNTAWNKINEADRDKVVELALENPELSSRELAWFITDTYKYYISESSVYRILKANGLISVPAFRMSSASDSFKDKTTAVNQMWQTDFTYFKIVGWGWYYLSTVLDDYSRYIVHYKLCSTMKTEEVMHTIDQAQIKAQVLNNNTKPKLLSDNGSCYISNELATYLQDNNIKHVRGRPLHPQTQGKIERYHRSMKNIVKLDNYYTPGQLEKALEKFVQHYNFNRYHEAINNLTPAQVYFGKGKMILNQRNKTKIKTLNDRKKQYQKFSLN
ncbi:IS3 family transposase [Snuella lapsa]